MARREAVVTAAARWVLLESIALITSSVIINESRLLLEKQIVKSFTKQRAGKVGGCEQERSTDLPNASSIIVVEKRSRHVLMSSFLGTYEFRTYTFCFCALFTFGTILH